VIAGARAHGPHRDLHPLPHRPGRTARVVTTLAITAALATAGAGTAGAAPVLKTVDATVSIDDGGTAQVELAYTVSGGADAATASDVLTFSALDFSEAQVDNLEVLDSDGRPLPVDIQTTGRTTTATVSLPETLAAGQTDEYSVVYEVPRAAEREGDLLTTTVPVLALQNPAAASSPGVFRAALELPPGYSFVEGFPANTSDVSTSRDGSTVLHFDVPAAPAVLQTVATSGSTPLFTITRVMEFGLLLALVLGALALYIFFVRPQRRPARAASSPDTASAAPPRPMERTR
jgi:hypothetical protein